MAVLRPHTTEVDERVIPTPRRRSDGSSPPRPAPHARCYEAGPTGYDTHRSSPSLGFACDVIAPRYPEKKRRPREDRPHRRAQPRVAPSRGERHTPERSVSDRGLPGISCQRVALRLRAKRVTWKPGLDPWHPAPPPKTQSRSRSPSRCRSRALHRSTANSAPPLCEGDA